jgi:tetratricopeptide (TPR) repeat protein
MKRIAAWLCWLGLAASCAVHAQGQPEPPQTPVEVRQAEALIRDNKAEQAYSLLAPLESSLAGNVEYDYLLGISAVQSGKPSQAVFALERVQAIDPRYKDSGLWLAIAYYRSGDIERAKPAFEAVLAQSSSAEARSTAKHYLDTLEQEQEQAGKRNRPALLGKVEAGIGHDSNITNSSPALSAPLLAAAVPAPSSNQGGMESILNLAVEGRVPISRHYAFASIEDQRREYGGNDFMNSNMLIARGGINFQSGGDTYKVTLSQRQFRQQGTLFALNGISNDYNVDGAELSTRLKMSARSYLGFVVQYNQIRFLLNGPESTDQGMVGLNFMHTFRGRGKPVVYFGYAYLYDQAVQSKISFNPAYGDGTTVASRATQFVSAYFQYSVSSEVDVVSTDYVYFRRDTGAFARDPNIDYGRDRTSFVSLGVNWQFRSRWSLRPQLSRTANRSNIPLYSYSKTEAVVMVRREFD